MTPEASMPARIGDATDLTCSIVNQITRYELPPNAKVAVLTVALMVVAQSTGMGIEWVIDDLRKVWTFGDELKH